MGLPERLRARLSSWGPLQRLLEQVRTGRYRRVLTTSGLFDHDHYRSQVEGPVDDAIAHYLEHGAAAGLSPHPLFDPAHYLEQSAAARRSVAAPYVEFLDVGCHRDLQPHPLFDPGVHLATAPGAAEHPHGAFGHFLAQSQAAAPVPADLATLLPAATVVPTDWAARAWEASAELRARPEVPPGDERDFDHVRAERLVAAVRSGTAQRDAPLVSIVLPTRDRREMVAEAISSVRAQTWRNWELLVVDDGGDDGTGELVEDLAADDERIRYRWQEHGGVAAARNTALAMASGEYVAYLDSDNTWEPEFLEVMLGVLQDEGHRAAHAASELLHPDGARYRSTEVDTDVLLARNHVDCITLVHERSLLDEVGTFDESLERFVDWDLLLRMSRATPLHHVPFIGTRYAVGDAARHERVTTTRSIGWRDVVQARHLVDWGDQEGVAGRTSVVLVVGRGRPLPTTAVDALLDEAACEVVVVDRGLGEAAAATLRLAGRDRSGLRVVTPPVHVEPTVARLLGCAAATGEVVVLAEPHAELRPDHVAELAAAVAATGGVVAPLLVDETGLVVGGAVSLRADGGLLRHGRGCLPDDEAVLPTPADGGLAPVTAVEQGVVACAHGLLRDLRGPDPLLVGGGGVVDLALRAADHGAPVHLVPAVRVPWTGVAEAVGGPPGGPDRDHLARRWGGRPRGSQASEGAALRILDDPGRGLPRRVDVVAPRSPARRWAIATCVPDVRVAPRWGDWHFAHALRDALVELGEHAVVDTATSRRRRDVGRDDVHVLLRGVNPVPPCPGATNLLWVISHPDDVTDGELVGADHVFVAGEPAAAAAAGRAPDTPVDVLLQCTDPGRFRPGTEDTTGLVPPGTVLFVGNSRGQRRRVLADAAAAGIEPVVVGSGWEGLVPASWVAATHVPNAELPALYAAADVVLNDHWPDMAAGGIVANRVFDVVAAGGVVVTDRVPGIEDLFGEHVQTYDGPDDLAAAIDRARGVDRSDHAAAAAVAREHSFLARARQLVAAADRLAASS